MDPTATEAFEFVDDREPTGDVLVCGLSSFGLAGLTAVDYLVDQTTLEQCGHVRAAAATITPPLRVGAFVTPVHERASDVEAALRLIETLSGVYDLDVDTGPLEAFAADVQQYYADLATRLEQIPDEQLPEDRMYM